VNSFNLNLNLKLQDLAKPNQNIIKNLLCKFFDFFEIEVEVEVI